MEHLQRNARQWHNQRLSAPWQSAPLANPNADDLTAERAAREETFMEEVASRLESFHEIWDPRAPDITAAMEEAITRKLRIENQALGDQIHDPLTKLAKSEQSRSTAEVMLKTTQQEQEKLPVQIRDQGKQIQDALNKPRPGEVSRSTYTRLRKEHDESKIALERIRTENLGLSRKLRQANRSSLHNESASQDFEATQMRKNEQELRETFARDKSSAPQDQKARLLQTHAAEQRKALQAHEKNLEASFDKEKQRSLEDQERCLRATLDTEKQEAMQKKAQHLKTALQDQEQRLTSSFSIEKKQALREQEQRQASSFSIERKQALQEQEQLEVQEEDRSIRMQTAFDEQEGKFAAKRERLLGELQDRITERRAIEQDFASEAYALLPSWKSRTRLSPK